MNPLLRWLTSPEWAHVVSALLHSLWQGALLAIALAVLMRRLTNPVTRYRCSLGALGLIVIAGIITWAMLNVPDSPALPKNPTSLVEADAGPATTTSVNPRTADKIVDVSLLTPPATATHWTAWLALAWIVGTVAMLLRAGIKVAGAENLRRSCQPLNDEWMLTLVAEACCAVDLARKIRVAVTDKLTSPAVVGVLVPTLILPLSLFTALTPEQIRFILLHELAHIRRGDYFTNLLQLFAEALLFFNPALWWISHQIRREREACCDALAIELSGAPADYARTLVHVAENILRPTPTAALAFGDDGKEPSPLTDRVQRLLVPGYRPALRLTWRAILTSLIVGGTLLVLSAVGTRNTVGAILTSSQPTTSPVPPEPGINPDVQPKVSEDDSNIQTTNIPILTEFVGYDLATAATFAPAATTGTGQSIDSILPLPIFRVRQLTTRSNVPFLGDLPGIGKLFTSEASAARHTWLTGDDSFSTSNWTHYGRAPIEIMSGSFTADESGEKIIFTNGAMLRFNDQKLTADFVQINQTTGEVTARGNVHLVTTNADLTSQSLVWNTKLNQLSGIYDKVHFKSPFLNESLQLGAVFKADTNKAYFASKLQPSNSILTEPQFRGVLKAIEQRDGINLLTENSITIASNREAQIRGTQINLNNPSIYSPRATNTSTATSPPEPLNTRTFDLPAQFFLGKTITNLTPAELKQTLTDTNRASVFHEAFRAWLTNAGVNLDPQLGKSTYYSVGKGALWVRATSKELDAIEAAIQTLTKMPPQVNLKVRWVEIPQSLADDLLPQPRPNPLPPPLSQPHDSATILSEAQMTNILSRIRSRSGLHLLSEGQVATRNQRQAQLQTSTVTTIVTGINPKALVPPGITATNQNNAEYLETTTTPFGPVIDVFPEVSLDQTTISLRVIPTLTEFLGYDEHAPEVSLYVNGKKQRTTLPLPRYRTQQMTNDCVLRDGETLVLGQLSTTEVAKQPDGTFRTSTVTDTKTNGLYVFVTATIIDPAGNRLIPSK